MRYSPWRALSRLPHVTLAVTRLPRGKAWWLPTEDAIVLDDRLGRVERRCALAHELAHAEAGDVALCAGPDAPRLALRQERRADRIAAERLIALDDLVDALLWARSQGETAEQLDVEVNVLHTRLTLLAPAEHDYIEQRLWAAESEIA